MSRNPSAPRLRVGSRPRPCRGAARDVWMMAGGKFAELSDEQLLQEWCVSTPRSCSSLSSANCLSLSLSLARARSLALLLALYLSRSLSLALALALALSLMVMIMIILSFSFSFSLSLRWGAAQDGNIETLSAIFAEEPGILELNQADETYVLSELSTR